MGHESAWEWIVSSVPQGSVLGPIYFMIYINDILNNLKCNTYLFADDVKNFSGIPDDTYINQLQSDINAVSKWHDKWHLKLNAKLNDRLHLKLNADKCKIMTVGKAHLSSTHMYKLPVGSQDLNIVTQERILESWLTVISISKATS